METSLLINLSIDALLVGFFILHLLGWRLHMLFNTLVSLYLNHVSLIYKQLIISFVISKPILVKDFFFFASSSYAVESSFWCWLDFMR